MTIVYTSLSTALVSYADFSRYRFEVDALYAILWVVLAQRCVTALRHGGLIRRLAQRWRSRALASPPDGS